MCTQMEKNYDDDDLTFWRGRKTVNVPTCLLEENKLNENKHNKNI